MHPQDSLVFLRGPLLLSNIRVQMIVPSFAALLADTTRKSSCNGTPVLGPMLSYHLTENVIFLLGPGAFGDERVILQFEPSIEALDL